MHVPHRPVNPGEGGQARCSNLNLHFLLNVTGVTTSWQTDLAGMSVMETMVPTVGGLASDNGFKNHLVCRPEEGGRLGARGSR